MSNKKIIIIIFAILIIACLLSVSMVNASTSNKNTKSITLKPMKLSTTQGSGDYFKVKAIHTKTKKTIKNLKIILKVFTGKKYKKIIIKTNKKGIAKYSTSKLTPGKHKVLINAKNSKTKNSLIKISRPKTIIKLKINEQVFDVKLEDNSATKALIKKLKKGDITIHAHDYGDFEKVGELGFSLPRNDKYIKTSIGDIVLYNGNEISIFYNSNSWEYTKLGKIQNTKNLKTILGNRDVTLTFTLK